MSMILAGASTGLLLGVLVGLAASPIVGTVVGAIVALASAFLGFSGTRGTDSNQMTDADADVKRFGVAALAITCLCGVVIGLSLRARDFLAPTPKELVTRWTDAGYSAARAMEIVAGRGTVSATIVANAAPTAQSTALFAVELNQCNKLSPSDHPNAADLSRAFTIEGGKWSALAVAAERAADGDRLEILKAGWALACQ